MISDYPKTNLAAANRGGILISSGPVTRRPEYNNAAVISGVTLKDQSHED